MAQKGEEGSNEDESGANGDDNEEVGLKPTSSGSGRLGDEEILWEVLRQTVDSPGLGSKLRFGVLGGRRGVKDIIVHGAQQRRIRRARVSRDVPVLLIRSASLRGVWPEKMPEKCRTYRLRRACK